LERFLVEKVIVAFPQRQRQANVNAANTHTQASDAILEPTQTIVIFLPQWKPLFFAPPFLIRPLHSSGERLRGHGSQLTRVHVQSAAEFLQHLYRLIITGCRRFCAQLTDPVFESAARHQVYEPGNPY
jgi:hypothetical protein